MCVGLFLAKAAAERQGREQKEEGRQWQERATEEVEPHSVSSLSTLRLGIDFGTCYSSAALMLDGIPKPIRDPLSNRSYSFPSSLFVTKQGEFVIGQAAEMQRRLDPYRYCREFKRNLGQSIHYPLGDQQLLPEELVSKFIRGLKCEAEKMVNYPIKATILTVPATYQPYKRRLMEKAAHQAGFEDVILLEEPVAAAFYYAKTGSGGHHLAEEEILLVYDLGGGTFDAALIQKQASSYNLLTHPIGDENCGGIDFDLKIYEDFKKSLASDVAESLDPQRQDLAALRTRQIVGEWCREFKHLLSLVPEYKDLPPISGLSDKAYHLSQQTFQTMIAPFIDGTCKLCRQLVKQANLSWNQVNRILLVGGSCQIPYVKHKLEQEFQRPVIRVDEPELAICFGAALYGDWLKTEGSVAYSQQGLENIQAGNYTEAIEAFNQALRFNPNYAEVYFYLGTVHLSQGLQAAIEDYNQALKINPNLSEVAQSREFAQSLLEKYQRQAAVITIPREPIQFEGERLSEKYTKLRDLLAAGKWKEADSETVRIMLKVAGRETRESLQEKDIAKFPCADLRTIDQLWVKSSNGRFGFTVQKKIYEEVGRKRERLANRVGWRVRDKWLDYHELTFAVNAPAGHLPYTAGHWLGWAQDALFSRRDL